MFRRTTQLTKNTNRFCGSFVPDVELVLSGRIQDVSSLFMKQFNVTVPKSVRLKFTILILQIL